MGRVRGGGGRGNCHYHANEINFLKKKLLKGKGMIPHSAFDILDKNLYL